MHTSYICPYILYPQSTLYTDWWYKEKLNGTFVNKYCMGWYLSTASSNKFHFYFFYFSFSEMYVFFFFFFLRLICWLERMHVERQMSLRAKTEDWRWKTEDLVKCALSKKFDYWPVCSKGLHFKESSWKWDPLNSNIRNAVV